MQKEKAKEKEPGTAAALRILSLTKKLSETTDYSVFPTRAEIIVTYPRILLCAPPLQVVIRIKGRGYQISDLGGMFMLMDRSPDESTDETLKQKDLEACSRRYGLPFINGEFTIDCAPRQVTDVLHAFYLMLLHFTKDSKYRLLSAPVHPNEEDISNAHQLCTILVDKPERRIKPTVDLDEYGYPYIRITSPDQRYEDGTPFEILCQWRAGGIVFFDHKISLSRRARIGLTACENMTDLVGMLEGVLAHFYQEGLACDAQSFVTRAVEAHIFDFWEVYDAMVRTLIDADLYVLEWLEESFGSKEELNEFIEDYEKGNNAEPPDPDLTLSKAASLMEEMMSLGKDPNLYKEGKKILN